MSLTPRQARRRRKNWESHSHSHYRCPACRQPFADCPHSASDVSRWLEDEFTRACARAALKRADRTLPTPADPSANRRTDRSMPSRATQEAPVSVVSDAQLRELLVSVRSASDDMAQARLRLAMEAVFDRACDDLRDVVAGRVVNVGGDLDIAKAVGDAVEEYHVRIKRT